MSLCNAVEPLVRQQRGDRLSIHDAAVADHTEGLIPEYRHDLNFFVVFKICIVAGLVPLMLHHASMLVWSVVTFVGLAFAISVVVGGASRLR